MHAPDQGGPLSFRRRRKAGRLELRQHKAVDRVDGPVLPLHRGNFRPLRGDEGPVGFIGRSLGNPPLQQFTLRGTDPAMRIRRRHHFVGIVTQEAAHQFAGSGIAGHEGPLLQRGGPVIETQFTLPFAGVLTVTVKAVLAQNRADVAVEGDRSAFRRGGCPCGQQQQQHRRSRFRFSCHTGPSTWHPAPDCRPGQRISAALTPCLQACAFSPLMTA